MQGMFVALAWEYYRRFRRRNDERLFLQVCVAVLLVLSTAFFALCAAVSRTARPHSRRR